MSQAKSFLGGKCAICGSIENLEIDHINPKTKLFKMTSITRMSKYKFYKELNLCQLLCDTHHNEKSRRESMDR